MLLVNAYVLCRETHHLMWKTRKQKLLTYFQFWKAIVLTWLTGKSCHKQQRGRTKQKCDGSSNSTITYSYTTLCHPLQSNRATLLVVSYIQTAMLGPTLMCSNVIFVMCASALISSSPFTRLLPSGTWSLKSYRSSMKNECKWKHRGTVK